MRVQAAQQKQENEQRLWQQKKQEQKEQREQEENQQPQEVGVNRIKARAARKGKDKARREKEIHPYQIFSTNTVNEFFMQKTAN